MIKFGNKKGQRGILSILLSLMLIISMVAPVAASTTVGASLDSPVETIPTVTTTPTVELAPTADSVTTPTVTATPIVEPTPGHSTLDAEPTPTNEPNVEASIDSPVEPTPTPEAAPFGIIPLGGMGLFAVAPSLDVDDAYLEKFTVTSIVDGTPDWDTSDDPSDPYWKGRTGNDENGSNGIVRSFDSISYGLEYATKTYGIDSYEAGIIEFEFVLPLGKDEAEWNTSAMSWMDAGFEVVTANRTFDFGNGVETVSCQVLKGKRTLHKTDDNPTVIPGSGTLEAIVNVLGMPNGSTVVPVFTAWVQHNHAGDVELSRNAAVTGNNTPCNEHARIELISVAGMPIEVTAEPRYNVQLQQGAVNQVVYDEYDFDTGNDLAIDKNLGLIRGMPITYGVTLQLYNNANRKLKGVEIPKGPITFDLELETTFIPSTGTLTDEQKDYVKTNYAPLILSYDEQRAEGGQQDGRNLKDIPLKYAVSAAPQNKGMNSYSLTGSDRCHNGGTWRATRDAGNSSVIKVTVSDYVIRDGLFPNANAGDSVIYSRYYNVATGVANIGCFSAGEFFILAPFYNRGITGDAKADEYILTDLGVADGTFSTQIKDVNLQMVSLSGEQLTPAADNSNQMAKGDDIVTTTTYLKRPGSFDWKVQWTNSSTPATSYPLFRDVIGRYDSEAGHWTANGLDTLTPGSSVALGLGFTNSEDAYKENRAVAANVLSKFDARVVTLTENGRQAGINGYGLEYQVLYATKPNGNNWSSDAEMNAAKIEDLKYYASLGAIPAGHQCIAVLAEIRPTGKAEDVIKVNTGSRQYVTVIGQVNNDDSLIDNVYQTVIGGNIWHLKDYVKSDGSEIAIPTMLGNDPDAPTTVPTPTYNDYRDYTKVTYNSDGSYTGHSGDRNRGDSLRIVETTSKVTKQVEQEEAGTNKNIFHLDTDQRYVDFAITPSIDALPDGVSKTTDVTIIDTLPFNVHYVDGSTTIGGTYDPNPRPGRQGTVTGGDISKQPELGTTLVNGKTCTTIKWVLQGVKSDEPLPVIHFSTLIGKKGDEENDAKHNAEFTNQVTIRTTGDFRPFAASTGNLATAGFKVSKLNATSLSKFADKPYYDIGDYMGYTINVGNNSTNAMNEALIVDTMPLNGDAKGSKFTGPISITDFKINDTAMTNMASWEYYYTTSTAAKDTISDDYTVADIKAGFSSVTGGTVTWIKGDSIGDLIPEDIINDDGTGLTNITAIAFIGNLLGHNVFKASIELYAPQAKAEDVFVNGLSRGAETSEAISRVVDRRISGLPWLDVNKDGLRSGAEEVTLKGIKVALLQKDASEKYVPVLDKDGKAVFVETSSTLKTTTFEVNSKNNKDEAVVIDVIATARADGSYIFTGLPSGDFGIRFEGGTTSLDKYTASPVDQDLDGYIDSDGVPTYEGGILKKTEITGIALPKTDELLSSIFNSEFHDSGFYMTTYDLDITKTVTTGDKDKEFTFSVELKDSANAPISGTFTTEGSGKPTTSITFTDGKATITLKDGQNLKIKDLLIDTKYSVTELNPGTGWTVNQATIAGTLDNSDKTAAFTNNYTPNSVNVTLGVKKSLTGHDLSTPKAFTFTLARTDALPETNVTMPTGTGLTANTPAISEAGTTSAVANFGAITFKAAGVYTFSITETASGIIGMTDATPKTVTVTVTDNNGNLNAVVTGATDNAVTMVNDYEVEPVDLSLDVTKTITGTIPTAKNFTFTLARVIGTGQASDVTMPSTLSITTAETGFVTGSAQTISFDKITFNKAGTYTFTITEDNSGINGMTDASAKTVTVTVIDNDGKLEITSPTTAEQKLEFINVYAPTVTKAALNITKTIGGIGKTLPGEAAFTFTIALTKGKTSAVEMPASLSVTTEGITTGSATPVGFGDITFKEAGNYEFTITETVTGISGMTYATAQKVYYKVTDYNGILDVEYVDEVGDPVTGGGALEFINTYVPTKTTLVLAVEKTVTGTLPAEKAFEFTLTRTDSEDANVVVMPAITTITTDAITSGKASVVSFDEITFKRAGTYTFNIAEMASGINGMTDASAKDITVEVTDTAGVLSAAVVDNDKNEPFEFINIYETKPVKQRLDVEKKVTGDTPKEDSTFIFKLKSADGEKSVTCVGAGTATFGEITYTEVGTYIYEVTEEAGTHRAYTYDKAKYTITDVVTDEDSQLVCVRTIIKDGEEVDDIVFTNNFEDPDRPNVTPTPDPSKPTPTPDPSKPTPTPVPTSKPGGNTIVKTTTSNGNGTAMNAKTGDTTQLLGFILLAIASCGIVGIMIKKRKKTAK